MKYKGTLWLWNIRGHYNNEIKGNIIIMKYKEVIIPIIVGSVGTIPVKLG